MTKPITHDEAEQALFGAYVNDCSKDNATVLRYIAQQRAQDAEPGFSDRAYIATAALQGLLAARHDPIMDTPSDAVWLADALLAELAKPAPPQVKPVEGKA